MKKNTYTYISSLFFFYHTFFVAVFMFCVIKKGNYGLAWIYTIDGSDFCIRPTCYFV